MTENTTGGRAVRQTALGFATGPKEKELVKEFRDYINKGNLFEIAVAFVMGIAFASVVTSLTEDILNPIIGKVLTVDNLSSWVVSDIRIGVFLVAVLNFVIVAFVMFLGVKAYNRMKAKAEEAGPSDEVRLLTEIRDELKTGGVRRAAPR
jgi:large conductance mechanosensitive channel